MTKPIAAEPDPYLPHNGEARYGVEHYELELGYRVVANRLSGVAVITVRANAPLDTVVLDLSTALRVTKVGVGGSGRGRAWARTTFTHAQAKLRIKLPKALAEGDTARLRVAYEGNPRPVRSPWGEVGFEELTEGALVASQPSGSASWFPCNDHPSSKSTYRFVISTDAPFLSVASGALVSQGKRASTTVRTFDLPVPTSTYLATLQIGLYERRTFPGPDPGVPMQAFLPRRLRDNFEIDFGRQPQMMALFAERFGPYPFDLYSVVITDDDLEIPIEAQTLSIFGANHCDGTRRWERLVAHELAHQWFGNSVTLGQWRDIWLHEGFAAYAEWVWFEHADGVPAASSAEQALRSLRSRPQDLVIGDPGAEAIFDDRVYKRGALTLHMLREAIGDKRFFKLLREWTGTHRYGTVDTDAFIELASRYAEEDTRPFFTAWLYQEKLPKKPGLLA